MSPYRERVSQSELHAQTSLGPVALRLGPHSVTLLLGDTIWTIANRHIVITRRGKWWQHWLKRRSMRIGALSLFVAHAWPTNEVGVWIECRGGSMQRVVGLPPVHGMSEEVLVAWRGLEQLATRLAEALADYGTGTKATEVGRGANRVLVLRFSERMVLYARPVFREKPRRVIELFRDGRLAIPRPRHRDRMSRMDRDGEIVVTGDTINFCDSDGTQVEQIFLPWIDAVDRVELSCMFRALLASGSGFVSSRQ